MVVVKPKKGESTDSLIKRFRRMTARIVQEARDRQHHETDADKRKKKRQRKEYLDQRKRQRND